MEVRDALADRELLSDEKLAPNRWNGTRVQIYPASAVLLAPMRTRGLTNLPEDAGPFIQLLLLLTEKGLDYHRPDRWGLAFIELAARPVDNEAVTHSGDVLVYDGATIHGVSDIDSTEVFDASDLRGRAVALATIYEKR